jgi:two-component system chemotaxis response regulator CheB
MAKIPQVNPDVITLDVEMPEMNGLETLAAIRKQYPRLPVIMFSTLTERGTATTLEALTLGASDYLTKPSNVGSVAAAQQSLREQLIPTIKCLCGTVDTRIPMPAPARKIVTPPVASKSVPRTSAPVEIVAIGVSTGGPNALAQLIPTLPADFPVPVVIVQHMPPVFTRLLAERLTSQSALSVREASPGDEVEIGNVYLAPGNYHMFVRREGQKVRIHTNQDAPENSCRPAVDVLFRSVADVYGPGCLGVVLTGMGQDGLRGCERIRDSGGRNIVQDEATSVVWGMPGFVSRAGLADHTLPLGAIASEIIRQTSRKKLEPCLG